MTKTDTLVIGFCGKAKAGKDSAAEALKSRLDEIGVKCIKISFADPIREIAKIFDFPKECLEDQSLKEEWLHPWLEVTPRRFMQLVGSELWRNNLDKDVWIKYAKNKITLESDKLNVGVNKLSTYDCWIPGLVVLISDVRFPNEAEMISSLGGIIFKVERTNSIPSGDDGWRKHESESFVDSLKKDETIYNNSNSLLGWKGESVKAISDFFGKKNIFLYPFSSIEHLLT